MANSAAMVSEKEIWQSASLMVKSYGSQARPEAMARAAEFESQGNQLAAEVWRRIKTAIDQLQAQKPDGAVN